MLDAILFDLDSTIADTAHRQWMVPLIKAGGPDAPTWDDYSMACADDKPIAGTVYLMRLLHGGYELVIVTGRSSAARDLTETWLVQHDVPYDHLLMRPAGDRTGNGKFKARTIDHLRNQGHNPVLFVEDFPEAADYIRDFTGLPVLLVNPGQFGGGVNENLGAV